MYKVKNPYKEASIMDLNMMDLPMRSAHKKMTAGSAAVLFLSIASVVMTLAFFAIGDARFLAECQNIPGGDICYITFAQ